MGLGRVVVLAVRHFWHRGRSGFVAFGVTCMVVSGFHHWHFGSFVCHIVAVVATVSHFWHAGRHVVVVVISMAECGKMFQNGISFTGLLFVRRK